MVHLARRLRLARWPWGLLGMLALAAGVERFVARNDLDFLSIGQWDARSSRRAAASEVKGCEVLCFGDSLVKLAVAPTVIEGRSGRRAFNLAVCGSQPPLSYFLLKKALDAGARPSAVVVDFEPTLRGFSARRAEEHWPLGVGPAELAELAWTARDADLFAAMLVRWALPSMRSRSSIREQVAAALAGRVCPLKFNTAVAVRNWRVNAGAQLMPYYRDIDDREVVGAWRLGSRYELRRNPVNEAYIGRFLALAARHGISVVWLLTPTMPALNAERERAGRTAEFDADLRRWLARSPNLTVVDARRSIDSKGLFMDPNHLARDGASAFSVALGDVLARLDPHRPGRPRWIELPTISAAPTAIVLEDITDSGMALKDRAKVRR